MRRFFTGLAIGLGFVVVTTARHEGSHALMAMAEGAEIQQINLLPGYSEDLGFYFGFVSHGEGTSWWTDAAPFLAALCSIAVCLPLLTLLQSSRTWWRAVALLGVLSPLADLIYNYQGGLWRETTDVAALLRALPAFPVHLLFVASIVSTLFLFRGAKHRLAEATSG